MIRFLIQVELFVMFGFAVVAGSAISYTIERRQQDREDRLVMVHLLTYSLKELAEVQTKAL